MAQEKASLVHSKHCLTTSFPHWQYRDLARSLFIGQFFSYFFCVSLFSQRVWVKEWPMDCFLLPFWPLEWLDLVQLLLICFCRLFLFTLTPFAQYFCLFVKLRRHSIIQSHRRGDLCFWGQNLFLRINQSVGDRGVLYFWNHTLWNQFLLTKLSGIFWIGFILGGPIQASMQFWI
jgi:hypothetical protein